MPANQINDAMHVCTIYMNQTHSTTQPVLSHAYNATLIDDQGHEQPATVVYRGIAGGHPVVAYTDGKEYYATRTSSPNEAPAFSFKLSEPVPA